jgi:Protein of unknown function (DUF3036).
MTTIDIPRPSSALISATQVLLGILIALGLAAELYLLPALADGAAAAYPEYSALRVPLLALAIAFSILAQLAVAVAMVLVHRIRAGRMLRPTSLLGVDILVAALVGGVALVVTAAAFIGREQAGSPFLAVVQGGLVIVLLALAGITLVLRSLLRQAITLRAELDEVV